MKYRVFILIVFIFMIGCTQKSKPVIKIDKTLSTPIKCLSLSKLSIDKRFISELEKLYKFDENCKLKLYIRYKTGIVCNSPYNPNQKNLSSFPTSFLNLEIRENLKSKYSYYIDLYDDVDENDIKKAFMRLEKDLINKN